MKTARRGFARLWPLAKIEDFCSSPRRADSLPSSERCFFGGEATEKPDFIKFYLKLAKFSNVKETIK